MKEFKEWVKDKVIAFAIKCSECYCTGECKNIQYYMNKSEYLEFVKTYGVLPTYSWLPVPEEYKRFGYLFNEKTRIG